MKYIREIAIAVLIVALCLATWQCDRNKDKLNAADATKKRMDNISTAQAGRKDIVEREKSYQESDKIIADIGKQRADIKQQETTVKRPQRKDIDYELSKTDLNDLADMFRRDGYSSAILER